MIQDKVVYDICYRKIEPSKGDTEDNLVEYKKKPNISILLVILKNTSLSVLENISDLLIVFNSRVRV